VEVDTRPGAAELLRAARLGDRAAWRELVARHTPTVWAVARSHRLDRDDAADVVQSTWLSLLENMNRIHDPAGLAAWLASTARRHALRRVAARRRESPVDEARLDFARADAADIAVLRCDSNAALWRAFTQLSEQCQRVLRVLVHAPELSYRQVAAALGIPVGGIGPTRGRCLAQLRRKAALAGLRGEDAQ
jgi:RNA polymerase sigma factor (sigma-70 family)